MYIHWLGHPFSLVAGAATLNVLVSTITDPLPAAKRKVAGLLEVNATFLTVTACAAVLGCLLYLLTVVLHIPNGGFLAVVWPAVIAESLIGSTNIRLLRAPDLVLALFIILIAAGTLFITV